MRRPLKGPKGALKGTRGAVMAEFIIAFMPIMLIYLTLCELTAVFVDRELIMHAANVTARACSVVEGYDMPNAPKLSGPADDATQAGKIALFDGATGAFGMLGKPNFSIDKVECLHKQTDDPYGEDVGHIQATYKCFVPWAKTIVCSGGNKSIEVSSSFPHQGAKYKMAPPP
jgi:hypothetical protein